MENKNKWLLEEKLLDLQVIKKREKREKEIEKNLENMYVAFSENPTEINRQNIYVNETEFKKLRDEQIMGLIIHAKAKLQVEG